MKNIFFGLVAAAMIAVPSSSFAISCWKSLSLDDTYGCLEVQIGGSSCAGYGNADPEVVCMWPEGLPTEVQQRVEQPDVRAQHTGTHFGWYNGVNKSGNGRGTDDIAKLDACFTGGHNDVDLNWDLEDCEGECETASNHACTMSSNALCYSRCAAVFN